MTFDRLQSIQKSCDEVSFSIHGKRYQDITDQEMLAHKVFHLSKALGKLATVSELLDHNENPSREQVRDEVAPDLVIYALQLSNLLGVDLDAAFERRIEHTLRKHTEGGDLQAEALAVLDRVRQLNPRTE